MAEKKLHDDEIAIDQRLVQQLLQTQFPGWASLPLRAVESYGTDNVIFRLGEDLSVRLPRIHWAADAAQKEWHWLQNLAPSLPLAIPVPLKIGAPQGSYPWQWSICPWLLGSDMDTAPAVDLHQAASDLGHFLKALHQIDTKGAPLSRRGAALATQDQEMHAALSASESLFDVDKVRVLWQKCLKAPAWEKESVWLHGDLLPGNVLVNEHKLSAIIDWGLSGIGDPACDLIAAWSIFTSGTREHLRTTMGVDDATWERGRGWALSVASIIIPYYQHSNPELVAVARRILTELLGDGA